MTHYIALALYIGALALWVRTLVSGERGPPARVAAIVATLGVVAHAVALGGYVSSFDELPLVGLAPSLSTLAFLTGLGLLSALRLPEIGGLGLLLLPLVVILEAIALSLGIRPTQDALAFQGAWFALHVALAFLAIAAAALSAAAGALYLTQHHELKHKRLGRLFHFLPPLADLDRIGRVMAVTSLVVLSFSLVLGWAWTVSFRNSFESGDPKVIWAMFVWGVLVTSVLARQGHGSGRARRGAQASVVGFGLIAVSYVVLRIIVGGGFFL